MRRMRFSFVLVLVVFCNPVTPMTMNQPVESAAPNRIIVENS